MKLEDIKTVTAIGTGAMGAGTALRFAIAGYNVNYVGRKPSSMVAGMKSLNGALDSLINYGLVDAAERENILSRITTFNGQTEDLKEIPDDVLTAAATNADFVIESIEEEVPAKQRLFSRLDNICAAHTIFATNTSALSPTEIAEVLPENRKKKLVVTHMWNPPHLLRLVEIVPSNTSRDCEDGLGTSEETMQVATDLMNHIGMKPVRLMREIPGFIGNRLQVALLRQAYALLEKGIPAHIIDAEIEETFGGFMAQCNPLRAATLEDFDKLKICVERAEPVLCNDTGVPAPLAAAVAAGKLGAKKGEGLFEWPPEKIGALKQAREENIVRHLKIDLEIEGQGISNDMYHPNSREPGAIGQILRTAVLREALYILQLGVAGASGIDEVFHETMGRRLPKAGPLKSADMGGLDIFASIFRTVGSHLCSHGDVMGMYRNAVSGNRLDGRPRGTSIALPPRPPLAAIVGMDEQEIAAPAPAK